MARFIALLKQPVMLKAFWAAYFLWYEYEHCPVTFYACLSGSQSLSSDIFWAPDERLWQGREQPLSLCQSDRTNGATQPLRANPISQSSQKEWPKDKLFADDDGATTFVLMSLDPVGPPCPQSSLPLLCPLVCLPVLFPWCLFNLPPL